MTDKRRPHDTGRRDSLGRTIRVGDTDLAARADAPAPQLQRGPEQPGREAFDRLSPTARRDHLAARLAELDQANRQARFVIDTALPVGTIRCVDCGRFVPEFGDMAHDCPVPKMVAAGLPEPVARELAQAGFDTPLEAHLWQTAINHLGVTAAGQWRTVGVGPYEAIRLTNLGVDPASMLPERPANIAGTIDHTRQVVNEWVAASSPRHRKPASEVVDHVITAGHLIAEQIDEQVAADHAAAASEMRDILGNSHNIPVEYHDRILTKSPQQVRGGLYELADELRTQGLDDPERKDLYDRLYTAMRDRDLDAAVVRYRDARPQATRNVLAEHRDFGGNLTVDTTKTVRSTLAAATNLIPTGWIEHSNNGTKLRIESVRGNGRAYYTPSHRRKTGSTIEREPVTKRRSARVTRPIRTDADAEELFRAWHPEAYDDDLYDKIGKAKPRSRRYQFRGRNPRDWDWDETTGEFTYTLNTERIIETPHAETVALIRSDTSPSSMLHELGHRFENTVPGLQQLAGSYRQRRIDPEKRIKVGPDSGEWGYDGGFVADYMGKVYPTPDTELVSTGLESVLAGSYGGLAGDNGHDKTDPDHRAFILGVLATVGETDA